MTENSNYYDDIEYLSDESGNEEERESRLPEHSHKKKVTPGQINKLISAMDGRDHIPKGKMKSDARTKKLLDEWDQLSEKLNKMGPPYHSSAKWRRIWTKVKSNRKCRLGSVRSGTKNFNSESSEKPSTVISSKSLGDTASVSGELQTVHVTTTSFTSNHSSSHPEASESVILLPENGDSVAGLLSRVLHEISSLKDQQATHNNEVIKRLDTLSQRQDIIEKKVNILASSLGTDFDDTQ